MPQVFSIEIVRVNAGLAEKHIDACAVRDRSMRCITMLRNSHARVFVFRQNSIDGLFPKGFPGGSFETNQMSLQSFHVAWILAINSIPGVARDQHFVADNNRTRHTRTRQIDFPLQILFVAECGRQRIRIGTDPGAVGTSKTCPV